MNNGQERFFTFIMERVELVNQNKAKELLNESFAKQDEGAFNREYMMNITMSWINFCYFIIFY